MHIYLSPEFLNHLHKSTKDPKKSLLHIFYFQHKFEIPLSIFDRAVQGGRQLKFFPFCDLVGP